jgi:hypothetical protein
MLLENVLFIVNATIREDSAVETSLSRAATAYITTAAQSFEKHLGELQTISQTLESPTDRLGRAEEVPYCQDSLATRKTQGFGYTCLHEKGKANVFSRACNSYSSQRILCAKDY